MILINLLPPELRRNRSSVNPAMAAMAAGAAVCVMLGALLLWVHLRIGHARTELDAAVAQLAEKTKLAEEVQARKDEIVRATEHRQTVLALLARKVYWARTIDDFASLLTTRWPGFEVCCTDLAISPVAQRVVKGATAETINYAFSARYRLVGEELDRAGDYVRKFLDDTEASVFWTGHGFVEKPDKTYLGDAPQWLSEVSRVSVDCAMVFERRKEIVVAKLAPTPAAAPKSGTGK